MNARQWLIVVGLSGAAALTLAACSGEPAPSPTTDAVEIEVEVEEGEVDGPGRVSVTQGARIDLTVESDLPDEVHVHGYDLTADVGPGQPARIEFRASIAGIFEIELEDSGLLLLQLEVTP